MADMMNAGSAVAGQLQDILTRKKAEQQQALVNQSQLIEQQSQMANRAEATRSMAAQRAQQVAASQAALAAQQRYQQGVDHFDASTLPPDAQKMFALAKLDPSNELMKVLMQKSMEPEQDAQIFDEPSGTMKPAGFKTRGTNPVVGTRNYPPQGPTASFASTGVDPSTGLPVTFNNHTGAYTSNGKPYTGPVGPKPTASGANRPILPPGMAQKGALLRAKAQPTPGQFWGTNAPDPKDVAANDEMIQSMLSQAQVSDPSIAETARQIIASGDPRSTAEILAEYSGQEGSSPQELNELTRLLYATRGE